MKVLKSIPESLHGAGIIAVSPAMQPGVKTDWHRRLRLYPGRSLSDIALGTEQNGRAGRLAMHGQLVSPGVISGLEVTLEPESNGEHGRCYYHIAAGMGLTASGEDVVWPSRGVSQSVHRLSTPRHRQAVEAYLIRQLSGQR
jgi:hypothetical protein